MCGDSLQRDPIQSHALPRKREKIVTDIKFLGSILLQIFLNSVHQPRQRSYCEPCASILLKAGTWSQAPALGSESIFWIITGMFFKLKLCFMSYPFGRAAANLSTLPDLFRSLTFCQKSSTQPHVTLAHSHLPGHVAVLSRKPIAFAFYWLFFTKRAISPNAPQQLADPSSHFWKYGWQRSSHFSEDKNRPKVVFWLVALALTVVCF